MIYGGPWRHNSGASKLFFSAAEVEEREPRLGGGCRGEMARTATGSVELSSGIFRVSIRSSADFFSLAIGFFPRRDNLQRLLRANVQAIDCFRNLALVGIGHHVSGIIHEVQVGSADHPV